MPRSRKKPGPEPAGREAPGVPASPDLPALYRRMVEHNRFLPVPKAELSFVGDGDFRAIGAEFLELFIRYGGLRPDCDVLDLGCGIGRMAVPLTQYLSPGASYAGVDVNRAGLRWCRRHIARIYPNFTFHHVDYNNPLYNPSGRKLPWSHPLPFAPGSFDFIVATSVFTHLSRHDFKAFARQFAALLRPGGRLFLTFFLLDETSIEAMVHGAGARLSFAVGSRPTVEAVGLPPRSAIAFRRDYVETVLTANDFVPCGPPLRGTWSGTAGITYQDIVVAERAAS